MIGANAPAGSDDRIGRITTVPSPTAPTTRGHHPTLSLEKRNMKWKASLITGSTDEHVPSSILFTGRATQMLITRGSQQDKYKLQLSWLSIIGRTHSKIP